MNAQKKSRLIWFDSIIVLSERAELWSCSYLRPNKSVCIELSYLSVWQSCRADTASVIWHDLRRETQRVNNLLYKQTLHCKCWREQRVLLFNSWAFLRLGLVVEGHLGFHARIDGYSWMKEQKTALWDYKNPQ